MKITKQVLSIPPYVSTKWVNVASLSMANSPTGPILIVTLVHGGKVAIPGLEYDLIQRIFSAHEMAMEVNTRPAQSSPIALGFPIKLFGDDFEKIETILQHNPDEADTPPLPPEVIERISSLIRNLGLSDISSIPMPEEGCNCGFCQVSRVIHHALCPDSSEKQDPVNEETVSEEDLRFCDWDITAKGEQLYDVTSRLDQSEHYQVYLGQPIGCTCGKVNCEHIRAVLKT